MSCLLRRVQTPQPFALPAAILIARCFKLAGKRMCRPLHFWSRWSRPLNRCSQLNKLRRVLQLVQAWLGAFPRHFRQACNPKLRPWQFLVRAFLQCRPLPPERLANCKVGQTLLSRPLSQLFRRRHFLSLLRLRVSRPGFSPPCFPLHQLYLFYSSPLWWHLAFRPSPPKLVSQIVSGKFVELSELLSSNIVQTQSDSDPQLFFDGRLVLTSTPKKPKRRIEDIGSWLEAFSVYCLVLTSQFPHRWKDLQLYQLLILRTYRQFTGRVWLAYDRAFREHTAATNLTDWSTLNIQLFNFHAAGASVRGPDAVTSSSEHHGAASSTIICRSWNRGQCVAPFASCRFAHKCQSCFGLHCVKDCPANSSSQQGAESKRPPASPPRSCSKSRRL